MIKMLNVSKGVLLSLLPGLLCISFVMVPAFSAIFSTVTKHGSFKRGTMLPFPQEM